MALTDCLSVKKHSKEDENILAFSAQVTRSASRSIDLWESH